MTRCERRCSVDNGHVSLPVGVVFGDIQTQIAAKINTSMQIIFLTGIYFCCMRKYRWSRQVSDTSIQTG
ncbi:Hypothetical protein RAK1035_2886 [Roseovarius sp. AK1035]|nr:Hypothetical protein RAK1035_2886 [Roseovarius sp. AK1035]